MTKTGEQSPLSLIKGTCPRSSTCNNEQFEHISLGDMYSIINIQDCPSRLKVRSGKKDRVYFFIFFFREMIDTSHRAM